MGYPVQGAGIPPEFYENIRAIKDSSQRIENILNQILAELKEIKKETKK